MIEFKLIGNWNRIETALEELPAQVMASAMWGQRKAAQRLVKIVKDHINNQDLGWAERSDRTLSNDPRTLVDTEAYFNSIKAWRSMGVYFVGVKRNEFDAKGRRISDYAILHENGAPNLPARPLWGPSIADMGGSRGIRSIVTRTIYDKIKQLRKDGFEITLNRL